MKVHFQKKRNCQTILKRSKILPKEKFLQLRGPSQAHYQTDTVWNNQHLQCSTRGMQSRRKTMKKLLKRQQISCILLAICQMILCSPLLSKEEFQGKMIHSGMWVQAPNHLENIKKTWIRKLKSKKFHTQEW